MTATSDRVLAAATPHVPDGPLLVALSGGPDSAVAAWVAQQISPHRPVSGVFVHHGWPGSDSMEEAAIAVAGSLSLPLTVVPVPPTTTEGEGRLHRLAVLQTMAVAGGAVVLTGHHADDQAETVLLHLLRGSGSAGLAGIPTRRGPFVRPLIDLAGAEVRSAAVELGLPFADDPANDDRRHLRNRIRHEVIPTLEAVQPTLRSTLVRTGRLLAADDAALERLAAAVPVRLREGEALIPWGALTTVSTAVASRVVRRALRYLHPPYGGEAADVDAVLAVRRGSITELSGGLRCERDTGSVAVYRTASIQPPSPAVSFPVPGRVEFGRVVVAADRHPDPTTVEVVGGRSGAWIDPGLADDLVVRPTETGERIDIGGGTKLVRDAMSEAGIPPRLRPGWPVVAAHGKIAWLVGVRVASWASTPASPGALRLSMERR